MTEPVSSSLPTCRALIQSIVAAVDARDVYTAHHSDRVAAMAVVLARVLHLSEDDTTTVQVAAFAHDIGKISMSDAVLRKAGLLTDAEREEMRRCPVTGYDILRKVPQFQRVALIVRHHHERWDGRGYPDQLAGTAIPLGARIIAVADSIDAMTMAMLAAGVTVRVKAGIEAQRLPAPASMSCLRMFPPETIWTGNGRTSDNISHAR